MKKKSPLISEDNSYKIVALLITLILWIIILGSKEATVVKVVSTDYLLPPDMMIVNSVPRAVSFRITGPRLMLKKFIQASEPLTVDLTSAVEGLTMVRIHPDSLSVPNGLRVLSVSPSTITPKLDRIISRKVPVEVKLQGELPPGKKVVEIIIFPPLWEVSGARSVVEYLDSIPTETLDLTELQGVVSRELFLRLDVPGVVSSKDAKVKVELNIQ